MTGRVAEGAVLFFRLGELPEGDPVPVPAELRHETFPSWIRRNASHPSRWVRGGALQHVLYARSTVHLLTSGDGVVQHRSVVHGRDFRFPFMSRADLMIGAVWTIPGMRGKGLAKIVLEDIVRSTPCDGSFWYVTTVDNHASVRVAESAGFVLVGRGDKRPRLGRSEFGSYVIARPVDA